MSEARQTSLMFNRQDLELGLDMLDRMEQLPSIEIANNRAEPGLAFKLPEFGRTIEAQRKRLRMLFLKTGQINSDLRVAQARAAKFPTPKNKQDVRYCFLMVDWHKQATDEMRAFLGLPAQTKWLTPGQVADIAAQPTEPTELNDLEQRYYADRRNDKWPFEQCEKDFGPGYKGWLRWKFENGLLSIVSYHAEKLRLAAL
jgi:hypothetical protein